MVNHTAQGDPVYDPFLGSGTTLIAAEMVSRRCFGMDVDASYVDVVVLRWQELTGKQAILESHGGTFSAVKQSRQAGEGRQ